MLENLFNLIKEHSTEAVINNPAIPNEKNDAVISDATHSVADGLQGVLAGGGLQAVLSLFNNNNNSSGGNGFLNNPIVSNIISSFTNKLTNNHGIAADQAGGIASSLIPSVLSSLVNRTNDPNNSSFSIGSIISSLAGGGNAPGGSGGLDIGSLVSRFASGSLDANNDGHVGIDDIISKVTGGAQQQQAQSSSGGLMDIISGFMK
ncbi:hypothetical protein QWZ08_26815 [Ferruginibacter paludis]|uniref:hypothetical protein n=1 Tax=Ferruginibacter paludis TaxID=1310417 RepID=UPI0025B5F8A9|nr:hypothetical protein [Ferruginibacter paludis]MDN3659286.1 hypothetical protein [Ferruginibacter paludis]